MLLLLFSVVPCMLFLSGDFGRAASDEELAGVIACIEIYGCFLCSLSHCLSFGHKDEAALIVLSGNSLTKIAVFHWLIAFSVSSVSGMLWGLFLLPEWIRLRFLFSYTATALLLHGMSFMIRYFIGNPYGTIGVYATVFLLFYQNSGLAPEAVITEASCARDPFIGGYMHQTLYGDNGYWYISDNLWVQNRILFFLLAVLLLVLGLLFTKRKLHYTTKR